MGTQGSLKYYENRDPGPHFSMKMGTRGPQFGGPYFHITPVLLCKEQHSYTTTAVYVQLIMLIVMNLLLLLRLSIESEGWYQKVFTILLRCSYCDHCLFILGIITTTPRVSSVFNGSQLAVSCSTTEEFLRWEFSVITDSESEGKQRTFT